MKRQFYVYILTNSGRTVLYTGVTNNLARRLSEHRAGQAKSFTKKYFVHFLIYYECFDGPTAAIAREKAIKNLSRTEKIALIRTNNRGWDFFDPPTHDAV